jgi:hypothetical protein
VKKVADETAAWEKGDSKLRSAVVPRLFVRTADFTWRRGAVFALTQHTRGRLDRRIRGRRHRPSRSSTREVRNRRSPIVFTTRRRPTLVARTDSSRSTARLRELGVAMLLETHFPQEDLTSVSEGWGGDSSPVSRRKGRRR